MSVPTGLGKTAMAVLGWLWRRTAAQDDIRNTTPRRLVYCLPTRVLVEQTRDNTLLWLYNLGLLGGEIEFESASGQESGSGWSPTRRVKSYRPSAVDPGKIPVYVLMGGEEEDDWDLYPERAAIIIGTQDMLLSRALNRGYAASRARWPMQFGLLNTDCLWVFDEIQLMGSGLATTAQLEAFRRQWAEQIGLGPEGGSSCRSVWMSATLDPSWLKTVDFDVSELGEPLRLSADDYRVPEIQVRISAEKRVQFCSARIGEIRELAEEIKKAHRPGIHTLVILNTVARARQLFSALVGRAAEHATGDAGAAPGPNGARVVLLHSRFRPADRKRQLALALDRPPAGGTIIISTQVIEAGVDLDAQVLITELAPWPALVQRFGRCNRSGRAEDAQVFIIDYQEAQKTEDLDKDPYAPYEPEDLEAAREFIRRFDGGSVSPRRLAEELEQIPEQDKIRLFRHEHEYVIRRKDIIELFDTTPDLAGNDLDIDRFVRAVDESDVYVFWRDYGDPREADPNTSTQARTGIEPAPARDELCPAPIAEFRSFLKAGGRDGLVWRWDFLERRWERADPARLVPGQVYLVHARAGGYSSQFGWYPELKREVQVMPRQAEEPDSTDGEWYSHAGAWQTVAEHTEKVIRALQEMLDKLNMRQEERQVLLLAARWHDRGKAHRAFLAKLAPDKIQSPEAMRCIAPPNAPGKAPADCWCDRGVRAGGGGHFRKHFRHELASALAVLMAPEALIPAELRDWVAYLVAAHHGKVRLSIRSLPGETVPEGRRPDGLPRRFARGVWDSDELPETDLGGGVVAPAVTLSLEPMEIGLCEEEPFKGQPSWLERMLRLRDAFGPFRLGYLEALVRAADMRVSRADSDMDPIPGAEI